MHSTLFESDEWSLTQFLKLSIDSPWRKLATFTHHHHRIQYLCFQIGGVVEGLEGVQCVQGVQMRVVVEGRVHLGQPFRGRKIAAWNERRFRRKAATLVRVITGAAARFLLVILAPLESLKNCKIHPLTFRASPLSTRDSFIFRLVRTKGLEMNRHSSPRGMN